MDYQKMKDYESKITLLLDNKRKGKITDKEHRKQTETLMQEAKKNLNDDEIKMLINYLQKSTNGYCVKPLWGINCGKLTLVS